MTLEESYNKYDDDEKEKRNSIKRIGNENENGKGVTQTLSNGQVSSGTHQKSKYERLKLYIAKSRVKLKHLVKHENFFWLVIFMVAVNTCIMATKHYEQPDWLTEVQSKFSLILK